MHIETYSQIGRDMDTNITLNHRASERSWRIIQYTENKDLERISHKTIKKMIEGEKDIK